MQNWINKSPIYQQYPISEFNDNPLISALSPPPSNEEDAIRRLLEKPKFSYSERELPDSFRRMLPSRLKQFLFPTTQHVRILSEIYLQIFEGYKSRNPFTQDGQDFLHDIRKPRVNLQPSSISFITGLSGMGKSTLARGIMRVLGKPVIQHSQFQGSSFTETQITYLMRNVPEQCTSKALCQSYGNHTDSLLDIDLYSKAFSNKSKARYDFLNELEKIITTHHIGALVLDEFQNLSLAGTKGLKELVAFLINLREQLGIPIILIGTYNAAEVLKINSSITRRLRDGGYHELKQPKSSSDEDWQSLCQVVWGYQWNKDPTDINDKIIDTLYDCSQGITGIMLDLFIAAQMEAIDSKKEQINKELIKSVYQERFQPLHPIINALRSKNVKFMEKYDDLYIKATNSFHNDPILSSIVNTWEELLKKQYQLLGIDSTDSKPQPISSSEKTTHCIESSLEEMMKKLIQQDQKPPGIITN